MSLVVCFVSDVGSGVGGSEKNQTPRERENTIMRNDMKGTLTFKYHNNRNGIRKDYKNQNGKNYIPIHVPVVIFLYTFSLISLQHFLFVNFHMNSFHFS